MNASLGVAGWWCLPLGWQGGGSGRLEGTRQRCPAGRSLIQSTRILWQQNDMRLTLADLQELCRTSTEESVRLEFKVCNELRPGVERHGKSQSRDDVVQELSKDVSAFLNSGGGAIIYGIREKGSRASALDEQSPFVSPKDPTPEKLVQWIRAHVSPPPTVDVYSLRLRAEDTESPWFLVVDIPQGQEAYMAKDKRFYKRIGSTPQPMEQYEVVDVMRRAGSASLDIRLRVEPVHRSWYADEGRERASVGIPVSVTSTNYVSAEYGALRFVLFPPLRVDLIIFLASFSGAQFEENVPLSIGPEETVGQAIKIRWGANAGNIVYPGDWYNFWGNPVRFEIPPDRPSAYTFYAFKVEVFAVNAPVRRRFYIMGRSPDDQVSIMQVEADEFEQRLPGG